MPADKASLTLATGRGSVPKESTPVTNSGKRRPGQRCGVVWKLLGHADMRTHRSVLANSARAEWARRPIQSDSAGSGSTAGRRPRGKGDGVPPTPPRLTSPSQQVPPEQDSGAARTPVATHAHQEDEDEEVAVPHARRSHSVTRAEQPGPGCMSSLLAARSLAIYPGLPWSSSTSQTKTVVLPLRTVSDKHIF